MSTSMSTTRSTRIASRPRRATAVRLGLVGAALALSSAAADTTGPRAGVSLDFPTPLSPRAPYDVDAALVDRLDAAGDVPAAQRLFDIYSWQQLIALMWPADASGKADTTKKLADNGRRVWESLYPVRLVFRPDGAKPTGATAGPEQGCSNAGAADRFLEMRGQRMPVRFHRRGFGGAGGSINVADENLQAFTGPLVDQYGKWVHYEALINDVEYDYIVKNELYNQEGQALFTQKNMVDFPVNQGSTRPGSMEIKLAWKQLGPKDIPGRFYTTWTQFKEEGTGRCVRRQMGLVGMHISVRTASAPEWIWATFEHVDNVGANDLERGKAADGSTVTVRPSFNNPDAPTLIPNVEPPMNAGCDKNGQSCTDWDESKTNTPVQVTRVVPIPRATAALNAQVQAILRQAGSVFQYYELVGAQWPLNPNAPAVPGGTGSAPESIVNKTPGNMIPVYVANTTMETYFQKGVQNAGFLEQDNRIAASQGGNGVSDTTQVFGTESCVGCHYSAGAVIGFRKDPQGNLLRDANGLKIPIYGINGSFGRTGGANYSWLLQIRAAQKDKPQKSASATGTTASR